MSAFLVLLNTGLAAVNVSAYVVDGDPLNLAVAVANVLAALFVLVVAAVTA